MVNHESVVGLLQTTPGACSSRSLTTSSAGFLDGLPMLVPAQFDTVVANECCLPNIHGSQNRHNMLHIHSLRLFGLVTPCDFSPNILG